MKSLKIFIPVFVVLLSACGTSRMMQSSADSGDDVYYTSSAETQPSSAGVNEAEQPSPAVQQPAAEQQYSTDADNEQIVTSSGDNTQDQNRSTVDSSGNTSVNNNYYGSSPYNRGYGYGNYGFNNYGYNNYGYGNDYGFGGGYSPFGYSPFGFSPGLSLSFGLGFGSPFYSGFNSFYSPFYSPYYSPFYSPFCSPFYSPFYSSYYYPGYYSPYSYGYGYPGYYNGYDYNFGNNNNYARNYTGIRKSSGTNSTVHVTRTPIQPNPGNHIINNGTVIQPREGSNTIKVYGGNNGNGNMQNQNQNTRPSIQLQNNNQPPHQEFQQAKPAPSNSNIPHQSAQIKSQQEKKVRQEGSGFMERVAKQNNLGSNKQDRQFFSNNSNKSFNWSGNRNSTSGENRSGENRSGGDRKPHF